MISLLNNYTGKLKLVQLYILIIGGILLCSCYTKKKGITKSKEALTSSNHTLTIGYTYWWPQNGPFIGNCGEKYSLVFLGNIINLQKEANEENYITKKGIIRIDSILTSTNLKKKSYNGELFISSNCFYQIDVKQGDNIMVFCYEYEGNYVTPGGKSILKIDGSFDPKVQSVIKYIQSGQNPLSIEDDLPIWNNAQLGSELKQIISCKSKTPL